MINYYKILGVKNYAEENEIRIAYRKLVKKFHPDNNDGDKFFEEKFIEVQNAYEILTNEEKKKTFDNQLKNFYSNNYNNNSEINHSEKNRENYSKKSKPEKKDYKFKPALILGSILFVIFLWIFINSKKSISTFDSNSNSHLPNNTNSNSTFNSSTNNINDSELKKDFDNNIREALDLYFTIGSTKKEVLDIQGEPTSIKKLLDNVEYWRYGFSSVTFKNNLVSEYSNLGKNLYVKLKKFKTDDIEEKTIDYITIGMSKSTVKSIQGEPDEVTKIVQSNQEYWYYGNSIILFEYNKVSDYTNTDNNLKIETKN